MKPDALHETAPPTIASFLLVGSTAKIKRFSDSLVTNFLTCSIYTPGLTEISLFEVSTLLILFIFSIDKIKPPFGVALPVRFVLPADIVILIFNK